jgi:dTDP-4-amino-4,6-dideoxygalactose transaminase
MHPHSALPRYPVFGPRVWQGSRQAPLPCLLDRPGALLTMSGRASIALALRAFGVGPGDLVMLPTYHCPSMVTAVESSGATPRFYPIDAAGAPRLEDLASDLRGRRPRAVLVVHFFGLPQPLRALRAWCDAAGALLIEDCAHALFGATAAGALGTTGDAAIGSLPKFLPGGGGCLVFNRPPRTAPALRPPSSGMQWRSALDLVETGLSARRFGLAGRLAAPLLGLKRALRLRRPPASSAHAEPARPAWIEAARVGDADLAPPWAWRWMARAARRGRIVARRRHAYTALARRLSGQARLRPLFPDLPDGAAPYVFPLDCEAPDALFDALRAAGIPVLRWDRQWPSLASFAGDAGARWAHRVLQLPCHQDLDDADLERVARACLESA